MLRSMPAVAVERGRLAMSGVIGELVAVVRVDVVGVDVPVVDDEDSDDIDAVALAVPFSSPSFFWMHFSMLRRRMRKSSSCASSVVIRSPDASCSGGESGRALDLMFVVDWAIIVVDVVAVVLEAGLGLGLVLGIRPGTDWLVVFGDDDDRGDLRFKADGMVPVEEDGEGVVVAALESAAAVKLVVLPLPTPGGNEDCLADIDSLGSEDFATEEDPNNAWAATSCDAIVPAL